jgi:hypothetical protein
MRSKKPFVLAGTAMLFMGAVHGARADVGFRIASNQLVTWDEDDEAAPGENWLAPRRVFDGDLVPIDGVATTNDPGFHGEDGTLTGFHLGFDVLKAARVWSVARQDFSAISPLSVTLDSALVGGVTTPASDPASPIAGPRVLVPAGEFDFHYDFNLNGSTPGIYLLELRITTDKPGIAASLPYWVTLNFGLSAGEHARADEWVQANLVTSPSALLMLGLGGVATLRRRR